MITRRENYITVDGIERLIDIKLLYNLSRKYLPNGMTAEFKDKFVDEVIFRIADLEIDLKYINDRIPEEYYFTACLAYTKANGYEKFFNEEDDGNIFEYCGGELNDDAYGFYSRQ